MKVKIKKLSEDAVIPTYSREGDAGMDLVAVSKRKDEYGNLVYGTGLAVEIPIGFEGQIRPRSSIGKYTLALTNSLGTVDSNYRGELQCHFKPTIEFISRNNDLPREYEIGDRIAQLLIKPVLNIEFEQVEELTESNRGAGGFGSSGIKNKTI